ncbi:hypothetical protein H312_01102 [Anncaliia algerae PRA339]|uniref:Uncharacterized protein n=1 Tax=Anncaliia algerae PRA339 TaxID=1288291 RepID=A0A059F3G4_9MICR|nr:hypothetical protein H312_01102 [Anncaliia algerae PRA339]
MFIYFNVLLGKSLSNDLINKEVKIAPLNCPGSYLGISGGKVVLGKESDAYIEKIGEKEYKLRLDKQYIAHKKGDDVGLKDKKKNKAEYWNIKPKNGGYSLKSSKRKWVIGSQYCLTHSGCGPGAKLKFKKCTDSRENQLFSIEPKNPEEKEEDDPFKDTPQPEEEPEKPEEESTPEKDIPSLEDEGEKESCSEESDEDKDPCKDAKKTVCIPTKKPDPVYTRPYYPTYQTPQTSYQYSYQPQYAYPTTYPGTTYPSVGTTTGTQGTTTSNAQPCTYPSSNHGNQTNQKVVVTKPTNGTTNKTSECVVSSGGNAPGKSQAVYVKVVPNKTKPANC